MEPEGSVPHSQAPAICLYPELQQSTPCLPIPLLGDLFWYYPSFYTLVLQVVLSFSLFIANLQPFFHWCCTKGSVQAWGLVNCFVASLVFTMSGCYHLTQPPSCRQQSYSVQNHRQTIMNLRCTPLRMCQTLWHTNYWRSPMQRAQAACKHSDLHNQPDTSYWPFVGDETKRLATTAKNLITWLIVSRRPKKRWPRDLLVPPAGNLK